MRKYQAMNFKVWVGMRECLFILRLCFDYFYYSRCQRVFECPWAVHVNKTWELARGSCLDLKRKKSKLFSMVKLEKARSREGWGLTWSGGGFHTDCCQRLWTWIELCERGKTRARKHICVLGRWWWEPSVSV